MSILPSTWRTVKRRQCLVGTSVKDPAFAQPQYGSGGSAFYALNSPGKLSPVIYYGVRAAVRSITSVTLPPLLHCSGTDCMSIVDTAHYRPQSSWTIFRNLLLQRRRRIWPPLIEHARPAGSAVQRKQGSCAPLALTPRQSVLVARPLPVTAWQSWKMRRTLSTIITFLSDSFLTRVMFHRIARTIFTRLHAGRRGRPSNIIIHRQWGQTADNACANVNTWPCLFRTEYTFILLQRPSSINFYF
ncbi:hypothetical protein IW262DRAFT_1037114 [Armillaria fumosa]|nr:hypothetical protein IW262DRAFT_1037114 [Armillaria fumosa]